MTIGQTGRRREPDAVRGLRHVRLLLLLLLMVVRLRLRERLPIPLRVRH